MDLELRDGVAVVTGGSSGIGLATARLFLDEGACVAICGRNEERLAAAKSSLLGNGAPERLLAQQCDVLDKAAVARFAAAVEQWQGRCDILINNAGQARLSTFSETSDEAWREELELKFFSQIHPVRTFKPLLERSDAAAILRVNSVMLGLIESGQWERRFAARNDATQTREDWYAEIARTRHIPMERLGRPDEVARAIAFLCSPAAGFITGAQLEISGGTSRHI